jgi:hypothetical protein
MDSEISRNNSSIHAEDFKNVPEQFWNSSASFLIVLKIPVFALLGIAFRVSLVFNSLFLTCRTKQCAPVGAGTHRKRIRLLKLFQV